MTADQMPQPLLSIRRVFFHVSHCGVAGTGSSLMETVSRTLTAGFCAGRAGRPGPDSPDSLPSSFFCRLFSLLALTLSESELHEDAEEDVSLEDCGDDPGSGPWFLVF